MDGFLDNDDIIIMGNANFVPNKQLISKLKYCEIKEEYKSKFLLQSQQIKITNYQTLLNEKQQDYLYKNDDILEDISQKYNQMGDDLSIIYNFFPY